MVFVKVQWVLTDRDVKGFKDKGDGHLHYPYSPSVALFTISRHVHVSTFQHWGSFPTAQNLLFLTKLISQAMPGLGGGGGAHPQ